MGGLISHQKSAKVLSVFNEKMDKFSDYVKRNKWRTLTRMSERVLNISKDPMGPGELDRLVKSIEKDFSSMVRITENSVLGRPEKSEIKSRIENLRTETGMLSQYLGKRAKVFKDWKTLERPINSGLIKSARKFPFKNFKWKGWAAITLWAC